MRVVFYFALFFVAACSNGTKTVNDTKTDTSNSLSEGQGIISSDQQTNKKDSNALKAIDLVNTLEEVKEYIIFIDNKSYGQSRVKYKSIKMASEKRPCYLVYVHQDMDEDVAPDVSLWAQFAFKVYLDKQEIMYYDAAADSSIELTEWRKTFNKDL